MGGPEQQVQDVPNTQEQAQEIQEQQKTPEKEISDRANKLSQQIRRYSNYNSEFASGMKIKESNSSTTLIQADNEDKENPFDDGLELPEGYIGEPVNFSLMNGVEDPNQPMEDDEDTSKYKIFDISIDGHGKMNVNGKNIPNEEAQSFLDKIEASVSEIKKSQEKKELAENQKKIKEDEEKDKQEADLLLASLDF